MMALHGRLNISSIFRAFALAWLRMLLVIVALDLSVVPYRRALVVLYKTRLSFTLVAEFVSHVIICSPIVARVEYQ
jgi:hypothetical protein